MNSIRQAFLIAAHNFRRWYKNPRIVIVFALNIILCFLLSDKTIHFAMQYHTITQILEPFVWMFGDATSILLFSLLLVLLFVDMPFITAGTPYYLVRTTRRVWLSGQLLYIVLATLIYTTFSLVVSMLLCAPNSFLGNQWSETAALLGYTQAGKMLVLPASIKTMEMSLPYAVTLDIFILVGLYTLLLMSIMLATNIRGGKFWGVGAIFLFSLYGLLLNPEFFGKLFQLPDNLWYRVNVAVGWASPLNQATFYMHNFGYDLLPQLWISWLIFVLLIIVCSLFALRAIKNYSFTFSGTD